MKLACCYCRARFETDHKSGERIRCWQCKSLVILPQPRSGEIPVASAPSDIEVLRGPSAECAWVALLKKWPPADAPHAFRQAFDAYQRLRPPAGAPPWIWTGLGPLDGPAENHCLLCPAAGDAGVAPCPLCGSNPFDGPDGAKRLANHERTARERAPFESQHLREQWGAMVEARLSAFRGQREPAQKKFDAILKQLHDSDRTAPLRAEANLRGALLLFTKGMNADTVIRVRTRLYASFAGALRREPVRLALAMLCAMLGEWGEALLHLENLPATGTMAASTTVLRALAEIENGRAGAALARLPAAPLMAEMTLLRARALVRLGRGADALPSLESLAARFPANRALHCLLAAADPSRAAVELALAEQAPIGIVKSRARLMRDWLARTAGAYDKVHELNRVWHARVLFRAGQEAQAVAALGDDGAEWRAHFHMARGRATEALPLYEKLAAEKPWNPEHLAYLGFARAKSGKLDDAMTAIQSAADAGFVDPRMTYFQSLVHVRQGHPMKAIPLLRRLRESRPDDAGLALNLGTLLYGQANVQFARGRLEDAAETWQSAADLGFERELIKAHIGAARFRSGVGRLMTSRDADDETLADLQSAVDAAPGEPAHQHYLGLARLRRGEPTADHFAKAKQSERFRDRAAWHEHVAAGTMAEAPGPRGAWLKILPLLRSENWADALPRIEELLAMDLSAFPASKRELSALAIRCLYKVKGAAALEAAISRAPADDADYLRGILAVTRNTTDEATSHFRRAAPRHPAAREALLVLMAGRAAVALAGGDSAEAMSLLESLAEDVPDDDNLRRWYDAVRLEIVPRAMLRSPQQVFQGFTAMESAVPVLVQHVKELEKSPKASRELDDARLLRRVVSHNLALSAHQQAIAFEERADHVNADKLWTRAVNYWLTLVRSGEAEKMILGNTQRAFDEADPAMAREAVDEFVGAVLIATCAQYKRHYESAGRAQRASLHLKAAEPLVRYMVQRNPENEDLRRNLAGLKFEQALQANLLKKLDEAVELVAAAVDLDPTEEIFFLVGGTIVANYAASIANKGDLETACAWARLANAYNPHDDAITKFLNELRNAVRQTLSRGTVDPSIAERITWVEERRRSIRHYHIREDSVQDDAVRAMFDCLMRGLTDDEILDVLDEQPALSHIPREKMKKLVEEVRVRFERGGQ